jgi:dolichol-phosphate mannosyltransferase
VAAGEDALSSHAPLFGELLGCWVRAANLFCLYYISRLSLISMPHRQSSIAVVIPCYRAKEHVLGVIERIGVQVQYVFVVDDACPEQSGAHVAAACRDPRVKVIRNERNLGVGGAVCRGYRAALEAGAQIVVKIDGDGQMPPELLPRFVAPIAAGNADYTKGNRFYDLAKIGRMPRSRIFGNAVLSFTAKLSGGYWDLFDPTNGYTAIHAHVLKLLPLEKVSQRYFFETDMLFRLNIVRAVVVDVPMDAVYEGATSNLRISRVIGEFMGKHLRNFAKRIFYNYFLRDVSLASLELVAGMALLLFGAGFGGYHWFESAREGVATPTGTIMIAAVSVLSGLQFVLSFLNYDIASVPRRPIHPALLD